MPRKKYPNCIDCGAEKTTYSQQLSPRCNSCFSKTIEITEVWLPIPDFPGYEVSNIGRVRSYFGRTSHNKRKRSGAIWEIKDTPQRMLRPSIPKSSPGYRGVNLSRDGETYYKRVSHLVMLAFVGPRPEDMDICHTNDDSLDNRLENLRYDTKKGNATDTPRCKRYARGNLRRGQVVEMRTLRAEGTTYKELANKYNVSLVVVRKACTGDTYKDWGGPITKKRRIKLSNGSVKWARKMRERGWRLQGIADRLGVSESMISRICSGERYGYVSG